MLGAFGLCASVTIALVACLFVLCFDGFGRGSSERLPLVDASEHTPKTCTAVVPIGSLTFNQFEVA